jgi:uncharacterized membrane protein (UPF0136 family)
MGFDWDTVTAVNLVLSVAILALGLIGFRRSGKTIALYVGLAFGLFGLSHLATLLDLKDELEAELIGIRTLAYLLVAFALYRLAFRFRRGGAA